MTSRESIITIDYSGLTSLQVRDCDVWTDVVSRR